MIKPGYYPHNLQQSKIADRVQVNRLSIRNCLGTILIFLSSFCCLSSALAQDPAPVTMLKHSTVEMLAFLKSHQSTLKSEPQNLERKIRTVLVPKFDIVTMAQSVVGRHYWQSATAAQQEAFIREFTNLVISVYSAPLQDYNGDRVEFFPLRSGIEGQSRLVVQTMIERRTGQRIAVNYSLKNSSNGWKVYDFSIEGISMVASYRSQFAAILQAEGLNGLVAQLRGRKRDV